MISRQLKYLYQYVHSSSWIGSSKPFDDINEELEFHIAERTDAFIAGGMDANQARQAAIEKFGDKAAITRTLHREGVAGMAWVHRIHVALTMTMSACVFFLLANWLIQKEVASDSIHDLPPAVASLMNEKWTGDVCGVVTHSDGDAIEGASVLMSVKTWPGGSFFQRAYTTTTDASGRYCVKDVCPVNDVYEVQIAVVVKHHQMQSKYLEMDGGTLENVVFALPESEVMQLQVIDATGEPIPGIRVLPHGRIDESGRHHVVYFDSGQDIIQSTDGDGQTSFAFFRPGDQATFLIEVEKDNWIPFDVRVPKTGVTAAIQLSS
ncbi:MAG: carboxypeptidase-like regulatory domain-containing protein [Planctomycetota bacterium]